MSATVHMIKMAPGLRRLSELQDWARARFGGGEVVISTRNRPKREEELLNGGSLYWVFATQILGRQRVVGIEDLPGGGKGCLIRLSGEIVPVAPTPKRAFQGWRYLDPESAPRDVSPGRAGDDEVPEHLAKVMAEMGLF